MDQMFIARIEEAKEEFKLSVCQQVDELFGVLLGEIKEGSQKKKKKTWTRGGGRSRGDDDQQQLLLRPDSPEIEEVDFDSDAEETASAGSDSDFSRGSESSVQPKTLFKKNKRASAAALKLSQAAIPGSQKRVSTRADLNKRRLPGPNSRDNRKKSPVKPKQSRKRQKLCHGVNQTQVEVPEDEPNSEPSPETVSLPPIPMNSGTIHIYPHSKPLTSSSAVTTSISPATKPPTPPQEDQEVFFCHIQPCKELELKFSSKEELLTHLNDHKPVQKRFICKWNHGEDRCTFTSDIRGTMVTHVRRSHFKIKESNKQLREKGIYLHRDPLVYIEERGEVEAEVEVEAEAEAEVEAPEKPEI